MTLSLVQHGDFVVFEGRVAAAIAPAEDAVEDAGRARWQFLCSCARAIGRTCDPIF